MKLLALMMGVACVFTASGQETAPAPGAVTPGATGNPGETPGAKTEMPEWIKKFQAMPEAQRNEYVKKFGMAERLNAEKRMMECLRLLEETEKLFPDNPGLYNLRGACYVDLRDFGKAIENFDKALKLDPTNASFLFNRAEADYAGKRYEDAARRFSSLVEKLPASAVGMRSLMHFKTYVSLRKLGKFGEAEALEKLYDIHDDTPYYFFVKAVKAFDAKNTKEAEASLQAGLRVYGRTPMIQPFHDTLLEGGYLQTTVSTGVSDSDK